MRVTHLNVERGNPFANTPGIAAYKRGLRRPSLSESNIAPTFVHFCFFFTFDFRFQIKMRFSLHAVLTASYILLADRSSAINYNSTTRIDCYSDVPGYKNNGTYTWQTDGYCQIQCVAMGYPVMALYGGDECLCGDQIPPNATKTTGCDSKCSGFPSHLCRLPNWRG